jgi:hypothetical protein
MAAMLDCPGKLIYDRPIACDCYSHSRCLFHLLTRVLPRIFRCQIPVRADPFPRA